MRMKISVAAQPVVADLEGFGAPISVGVYPGTACSMKVEFSLTNKAGSDPDDAEWFDWAKGTVSSKDSDVLIGPVTALRFTRVTGSVACSADIVSS